MRFCIPFILVAFLGSTLYAGQNRLPDARHVHFAILAGGGGTRLWPLSRENRPKQFLRLGQHNLVEQSILRLGSYPQFVKTNLVISTAAQLAYPMQDLISEMHLKNPTSITVDPTRRDTAPAILLNLLSVLEKDPDATVAFLPADPYIPSYQNQDFVEALERAISLVEENPHKVVLLGKTPTYAATGFGYIETKAATNDGALKVASFKEKPDTRQAQEFIASKKYLWNMGIFVAKARFFAQLFEQYAPTVYSPVSDYMQNGKAATYDQATSVSVDIAVMQPASRDQHLLVLPVNFSWDDVGDVKTYIHLQNNYLASIGKGPIVYEHGQDSHNNMAFIQPGGKLVAFVGVNGLCVVDTIDAMLVMPCDQGQRVKGVVEHLKHGPHKHVVE